MSIIIDLSEKVKAAIQEDGPLSIADFIKFTLQHYEQGYYPTAESSIDKGGDFISAPEISTLFGEIIGKWCINFWQSLKRPKKFNLIELGPGNGVLMRDLLKATQNVPSFHDNMDIHLIEINPNLIQNQIKNIKHPRIKWHKSYDKIKDGLSIIIANEFFNTLPINQYIKKKNKWYINMVDTNDDQNHLYINYYDANENIRAFLNKEYRDAPEGAIVEIHDEANILTKKITEKIKKHGGIALIIGCGYTENKNRDFISTLQSIRDQKFYPLFKKIGATNIKSHVNFSALADTAKIYGTSIHGPITQREFLLNMQIDALKDSFLRNIKNKQQKKIITSGYERLINPEQLGDLFKIMAIAGKQPPSFGF
jgi:NADH dehydrogenase [ubiquinone] 1 alpha subcomplex assembly factor 7